MTNRVNRRTKIVATIGPASESAEQIGKLVQAGVDVFRLNFSHGTAEQHGAVADRIRKQANIHGRYVGILADLQGPKIRISSFRDNNVALTAGERFRLDSSIDEDGGDQRGVSFSYLPMLESRTTWKLHRWTVRSLWAASSARRRASTNSAVVSQHQH